MLDISKISHTSAFAQDWYKIKLGKFSGSEIGKLIGAKSDIGVFTEGAITYIEGVAGEIITGKPKAKEFFTDDTDHGNSLEPEAINYFVSKTKLPAFRNEDKTTHKFILQDKYSGVTPDALLSMTTSLRSVFDETGTKLKVYTLEVKCPAKHHRFIKLMKCTTPAQLKIVAPMYYWQTLTQIDFCDALKGFFACYNPDFKDNPMGIIEFRKIELMDDINKLNKTLFHAKAELERTVNFLKTR